MGASGGFAWRRDVLCGRPFHWGGACLGRGMGDVPVLPAFLPLSTLLNRLSSLCHNHSPDALLVMGRMDEPIRGLLTTLVLSKTLWRWSFTGVKRPLWSLKVFDLAPFPN